MMTRVPFFGPTTWGEGFSPDAVRMQEIAKRRISERDLFMTSEHRLKNGD
jgi:hypothetical protein|tara:strand:- start:263 stop:412 length:150 start_codon:yes stop_codon:yes gene_type:complete